MLDYNFSIEKLRFHLIEQNTLVLIGWYRENNPQNRTLEVLLDDRTLSMKLEKKNGVEIRQKYLRYQADVNEEIVGYIELPEDWKQTKKFMIVCVCGEERKKICMMSTAKLIAMQQAVDYFVETEQVTDSNVKLIGWSVGRGPVSFEMKDDRNRTIAFEVKKNYRKDIHAIYEDAPADYEAGFQIVADRPATKGFTLSMKSGDSVSHYHTTLDRIAKGKGMGNDTPSLVYAVQKARNYYERNGFTATLRRVKTKLTRQQDMPYDTWRLKRLPSKEELLTQREMVFDYQPLYSIVIPMYQTPEKYLRELIESVQNQTYANWELCLADGSPKESSVESVVAEYSKTDDRIRYNLLEDNGGISLNTNAAVEMAKGDYIVFSDHDDLLAPEALFECTRVINENRSTDMIYTDEDKIDMEGKKYFEPNFKPDLNIDLLCSMNYICHLCVVKHELIEQVGMLRNEFDGAQDYDFILRCVEAAEHVHHIPKVLYHWRCHVDSTAANPESKLYAFEAGKRAIEAHYERMHIPATVEHSEFYGMYRSRYHWEKEPLISIIIPNKDHTEDLAVCMNSIIERSAYRNFEFVVVENNSTEDETFAYYKKLEQEHDNVTIVYYEGDFNFSKINNYGVGFAKGEYLLLLNNDTEIINEECLSELLGYCMREDVGIVGAKLCYEDDTIQHAGVVMGFGGMAGHTFIGASRYDLGYQGRIACAQDYSAVTAACMLTRRSIFEEVGGMSEDLAVAFNDIDYCMKVVTAGYHVVYNPYAQLYHYESKSRGLEDTPEKVERFNREVAIFTEKWTDYLKKGDPYYNPNLTLDKPDFSLKM